MDSQAKYATIARGAADIYLRLPTSATYEEKIWVRPVTLKPHSIENLLTGYENRIMQLAP